MSDYDKAVKEIDQLTAVVERKGKALNLLDKEICLGIKVLGEVTNLADFDVMVARFWRRWAELYYRSLKQKRRCINGLHLLTKRIKLWHELNNMGLIGEESLKAIEGNKHEVEDTEAEIVTLKEKHERTTKVCEEYFTNRREWLSR